MSKNWLIRTKENQILGPVSKEKIKEFLSKGALKENDEICRGNGFWFWIKEKDLINKYIMGDETPSFNPVTDTKNILNFNEQKKNMQDGTDHPSDIKDDSKK